MSQMIEISAIEVGERLRAVDPDHVAVIADSIRECGRILQPITVGRYAARGNELRGRYVLLAGAHRLEAAKLAGLMEVPAEIDEETDPLRARLIEIDENLVRHELNPLDRAVFLAERKAVYEALHPDTRKGAKNQYSDDNLLSATIAFSKDAAERTGLGVRTIETAVKIARGLTPEIRKRLAGTDISKNQKELALLSKQTPENQLKIADMLFDEGSEISSVRAAIARFDGNAKSAPDAAQVQLKRLMDAWRHAGASVRGTFVNNLSASERAGLQQYLIAASHDAMDAVDVGEAA
jgi:ParB family chromosome partitioning protein